MNTLAKAMLGSILVVGFFICMALAGTVWELESSAPDIAHIFGKIMTRVGGLVLLPGLLVAWRTETAYPKASSWIMAVIDSLFYCLLIYWILNRRSNRVE